MSEPLLQLTGVRKSYRKSGQELEVFDDLNLSFRGGEFVAIMGPSGSGKSTLLHLLAGIDRVDGGSILFKGAQIQDYSESSFAKWRAVNVGFIFQFYNLMPMLTARENVELPLLLGKGGAADRAGRVATALDIVGLSDRSRHFPKELSGGQQQRVAIARAIVSGPSLILADEPTGDLDRATAEEILTMLKLLGLELGKTVIMVTHDPLAASHASRVLHLDKGRFEERAAA
jgi:putative ABC transport system ATP-binding protein